MKKILFLLLMAIVFKTSSIAQNQTLYLIFDKNAPKITKDVRKMIRIKTPQTPIWRECGMYKFTEKDYVYSYPLMYGALLWFIKKDIPSVQTINLLGNSNLVSQVKNLYPNALTIDELDQNMQYAVDYDYNHPVPRGLLQVGQYPQTGQTEKYFLDNFNKIFLIELLPQSNEAKIIPVRFKNKFFGNY
ncbi:MAG: hypothetical protein EAZ06_07440 [Cytophagales bacterium]|nr:MAG: hypothetical protein EAZ06_07440 [Cytophagales bacterium]